MPRLAFPVVLLLAVTSCYRDNPKSCELPENAMKPECGGPGSPCADSNECMSKNPAYPVCDKSQESGGCVACTATEIGACKGNTPRCETNTCVACAQDTRDCGVDSVCLQSGACSNANSIIHVRSNGSEMNDCGSAGKACTLEKALTIATTNPDKSVIKLDDAGPYVPKMNHFVVDANVTISMRIGAALHKREDGPILEIRNNKTVVILGGTIEGATGSTGDGILCNGTLTVDEATIRSVDKSGINAAGGCNLTVTNANISDTSKRAGQFVPGIFANGDSITLSRSIFLVNPGGGIAIRNGMFIVVGNVFLNNGNSSSSTTGGITISTAANVSNRLDFNTVARNTIQDGPDSGGIDCSAGTNFVGKYNIIWNNKANTDGSFSQVSGGCKYAFSDFGPMPVSSTHDSGSNLNVDPLLMNDMSDAHLLNMNSPAIGYAPPTADLTGPAAKDIDGDARANRAPKGADIGADQYSPRS